MKKLILNTLRFIGFCTFIMLYVFGNCQPQPKSEVETKPWIGKWVVVEGIDSSGVKFSEMGVYHYYANGTFSSQLITSLDRPALTSNPSTPGEYVAAFDSYRAGFGTYTVNEEEGTLTYQYICNLRPHRIEQPTKVPFKVEDDKMTLFYDNVTITLKREKTD